MSEEQQNQAIAEEHEEYSTEELAESNNFVLNALIDLLIEKKVITEEELNKKYEQLDNSCCDDDCECFEDGECECSDDCDCECSEEKSDDQ